MIKEYISKKDNKKYYEVKNEYLGTNIFTGKEKRISKKGFTTKKQAKDFVIKAKHEFLENGKLLDSSKLTFNDVYKLWSEQHFITVKQSTIDTQTVIFKKNILPVFEKIKINKITLPHCQQFINSISEKFSLNYIKQIKMLISCVLDYAVKMGNLTVNYMKYVKLPKKSNIEKVENYYTKSELLEFLEIVKNNYSFDIYVMFHTLAFTGLRRGELLALKWLDIDFKNKTLSVNKNMSVAHGKMVLSTTKTKSSDRVILLDKKTLGILKEYRQNKNTFNFDGFIFEVKFIDYIEKKLKIIYNDYPTLKKITTHGFRHTHASLLFESGINVKDVQKRLGHSDVSTTLNIYTHVSKDKEKKSLEIFSNFMSC